jgi:hypothetical protein
MNHTITRKKPGFFRGVRSKFRNLFRKEKKIVLNPVEYQSKNVEEDKCDKQVGYNVYQKLATQFTKYIKEGNVESSILYKFKIKMIGLLFRDYPELFADPSISGEENRLDYMRENIINRATEDFNEYLSYDSIIKKWIDEGNTSRSNIYTSGGSKKSIRKQNKKHTRKSKKSKKIRKTRK